MPIKEQTFTIYNFFSWWTIWQLKQLKIIKRGDGGRGGCNKLRDNMADKKWNKLQNWCDVLIAETKYCKFGSETTTVRLFFSCYVGKNSFLLWYCIYLYICLETLVFWVGSFLILVKNKRGCCNENVLVCIFKIRFRGGGGGVYSTFESTKNSALSALSCFLKET